MRVTQDGTASATSLPLKVNRVRVPISCQALLYVLGYSSDQDGHGPCSHRAEVQMGKGDKETKQMNSSRYRPEGRSKRENVLRNLADKVFDKPICEALLDQRFFNGIGNYLRAEILYRLRIPPFEKARKVLEALQQRRPSPELTLSQKIKAKLQNPDLLELCHSVPKEVVQLGGKGYGPESGEEDFAAFRAWLQCYGMPGMSSLQDRRGRTIWFQGDPGPLAPKGGKSRKRKSKRAQQDPEDRSEDPLLPSTAPSRTRGAQRGLPEQTTAQQPEGTSLPQDPEVPLVPKKGKRRGRPTTSGHRRP
ncbi:endonuclease 8-like 1 isoform X2 [Crocuta crocuta]